MNILIIVLSLVSAYVLFVSVSYILARLLFPKIEVNDSDERPRMLRVKQRRLSRIAK
jgi:hypothetical protein